MKEFNANLQKNNLAKKTICILGLSIIITLFAVFGIKMRDNLFRHPKNQEYKTEVETFMPGAPSKTMKGSCWVTSLASPLNDKAWRCMTGDFIYDPCFETTSGKVVCNSFPDDTSKAFTLDLEKDLPDRSSVTGGGWRYYSKENPDEKNDFWILELENGHKCYAMTGTLPLINKQVYYYACTGNGEAKYAGLVNMSSPVFTTTIISEEFGEQENIDSSEFQDVKILKVWK